MYRDLDTDRRSDLHFFPVVNNTYFDTLGNPRRKKEHFKYNFTQTRSLKRLNFDRAEANNNGVSPLNSFARGSFPLNLVTQAIRVLPAERLRRIERPLSFNPRTNNPLVSGV